MPGDVIHRDLATSDGGSIHVIEAGHGRPLVLVHGVGLAAEVWAPLFHLAADRYRIIAMDVRGHGDSRVGSDGVGHLSAAHDLAGLLETLDLHEAVVCGHSMGGVIIGAAWGTDESVLRERVAGMVMVSTGAAGKYATGMPAPVAALSHWATARADEGRPVKVTGKPDDELLITRLSFGRRPSGAAVEVARRLSHDMDERYRSHWWADLLDYDNTTALRVASVPSVVVVGGFDAQTPRSMARNLTAQLTDSELVVLPGAGHQLMQERPLAVVAAIDDLVARLDAPAVVLG